jgi:hypothetical protein
MRWRFRSKGWLLAACVAGLVTTQPLAAEEFPTPPAAALFQAPVRAVQVAANQAGQARQRRVAANRRAATLGPRVLERLMRMPPAERRRFLRQNEQFRNLPLQQRLRLQQRLHRLSQLPPEQREQVLERYRLFDRLPPDKQTQARQVYQRWRQLPKERRAELLEEFETLKEFSPSSRKERLASKEFQKSFNEDERGLLSDLTALLPPDDQER